jgi:hypothetical protein
MSNSAFKRSEAEHHNEQYAAKRWREKNNLPEWANVPHDFFKGKSKPIADMIEKPLQEKINEVDELVVQKELSSDTKDALEALGNVTLTPSIPMSEALQDIQKVHRPSRENQVAVIGSGSGNHGRGKILMLNAALAGELGREQAREDIKRGIYGTGI